MHAERNIESASLHSLLHVGVSSAIFRLVENDKLDVGDIADKRRFSLSDQPGNARLWPVVLQVAGNRQRVTGIADRRKSDEADILGFGFFEQLRQFDNLGRTR